MAAVGLGCCRSHEAPLPWLHHFYASSHPVCEHRDFPEGFQMEYKAMLNTTYEHRINKGELFVWLSRD
jgi:hypothetical protein